MVSTRILPVQDHRKLIKGKKTNSQNLNLAYETYNAKANKEVYFRAMTPHISRKLQ